MFGRINAMWVDAGLRACIEGVVREAEKGNVLEAQKWFFKLKVDGYRAAMKQAKKPAEIEEEILAGFEPAFARAYRDVVIQMSKDGGFLEEVNQWLKVNGYSDIS